MLRLIKSRTPKFEILEDIDSFHKKSNIFYSYDCGKIVFFSCALVAKDNALRHQYIDYLLYGQLLLFNIRLSIDLDYGSMPTKIYCTHYIELNAV